MFFEKLVKKEGKIEKKFSKKNFKKSLPD